MAAVVLIYNHMSTSSCGDKKENDLSFMEWKEDEEIDGTWSQSRLEDEKEKDESESEKEKDEYKKLYITKDDSINIMSDICTYFILRDNFFCF